MCHFLAPQFNPSMPNSKVSSCRRAQYAEEVLKCVPNQPENEQNISFVTVIFSAFLKKNELLFKNLDWILH
jgi:hypothetical protein